MPGRGIIFLFILLFSNISNCNPWQILLPTALVSTFSDSFAVNKQTSAEKTKSFFYDSIKAEKNPAHPPDQIPLEFIPKGSRLLYSIKLHNDHGYFLDVEEVALIMENPLSINELTSYYDKIIPALDWKILQTSKEPSNAPLKNNQDSKKDEILPFTSSMILAEGNGKTNLAVILTKIDNGTKIKLFFKKPSLFD